mgnify:CR=1 FL=1
MPSSMTGFGDSNSQNEHVSIHVEIRTLNHRNLRIHIKGLDNFSQFEPHVESIIRDQIRRGTVQVVFNIVNKVQQDDFAINETALVSYWKQLEQIRKTLGDTTPISLAQLLMVRGIIREAPPREERTEELVALLESSVSDAMEKVQKMRLQEAQCMTEELASNCSQIKEQLDNIQLRAPNVIEDYRHRLHERIQSLLPDYDIPLQQESLIKELTFFAERCDIREEIIRLQSHLDQFSLALSEPNSEGRKLEFISQEMVRETNTIGSKANDVEIGQRVVEIKGCIDRIRELVQNVE